MAWYDVFDPVGDFVKKAGSTVKDGVSGVLETVVSPLAPENIVGPESVPGIVYNQEIEAPLETPTPDQQEVQEEITEAREEVAAPRGRPSTVFAGRRNQNDETLETRVARRSLMGY